jgi:hypothetical protein
MSAQDGMNQSMGNMMLLVSLHFGILESAFGWQNPPCHAKLAHLPLLGVIRPAILQV